MKTTKTDPYYRRVDAATTDSERAEALAELAIPFEVYLGGDETELPFTLWHCLRDSATLAGFAAGDEEPWRFNGWLTEDEAARITSPNGFRVVAS